MPESKAARPAHRPSRRHQLIAGAVELFAIKPPDLVTIAEIVRHVGMTPAAFYYHFASRDELFSEVVASFGDEWAKRAEEWWAEAHSEDGFLEVIGRLLDCAVENRQHATVFFVTSKGVSLSIEETRSAVTSRCATAAAQALVRSTARDTDRPPSTTEALDAFSVTTVIESCLRAELSLDVAYRTLGPGRFRDEALELCRRVLGAYKAA